MIENDMTGTVQVRWPGEGGPLRGPAEALAPALERANRRAEWL